MALEMVIDPVDSVYDRPWWSNKPWPGLEVASPAYGLASSSVLSELPVYLEFYTDGCWVQGVRNCTALCTQPELIWGDTQDIHFNVTANVNNCLNYMILAAAMKVPFVTIDTNHFADFGIGRQPDRIPSSSINASIAGCITSYCQTTNKCQVTKPTYDRWFPMSNRYNETLVLPNVMSICSGVTKTVNPDIAGIGILTAYLFAAIILVLIHIALRISWNFSELAVACYLKFRRKLDSRASWAQASNVQQSVASSKYISILVTALADFQKAQCVFWMAFNIALLVCLAGSAQTLAPPNLASLYADISALAVVCHCAMNLVAFGLYCLHRSGKRSWYIYSLSIFTVTFSAITWGTAYRINGNMLVPDVNATRFEGCGALSPVTYCRQGGLGSDSFDEWGPNVQYAVALPTIYLILFGLTLDMLSLNSRWSKQKLLKWWVDGWNDRPWMLRMRKTVRCAVECWFLLWVYTVMASLISLYPGTKLKGAATQWSFGQVIALTLWLPVILEWLYATCRGLENASDHRFATPYKVVCTDNLVTGHQPAQNVASSIELTIIPKT